MNVWMEIAILIITGVIGWFIKTGYDSVMGRINSKVDKSTHDACIKHNDDMFKLMIDEIKGLREDFRKKSDIVVKAVGGKK